MTTEKPTKAKTEKVTEKVSVNKDTKQERFRRIASEREHKVIDRLAILGRIADNPQNYEFTTEQVMNLFEDIEAFTLKMKNRFLDCIGVKEIKDEYKTVL